jgi:hypothetical protein
VENTTLSTWAGSSNITILGTITTGSIPESKVTFTDITTGNVSTSNHGFAPKAPNDTTKYLRGDGTWAVPAGGGGSTTVLSLIPRPNFIDNGTLAANMYSYSSNTTMRVTQVCFPFKVSVNKLSFYIGSVSTGTTLKMALFSEDGSTRILTAESGAISASGVYTITLGSTVDVNPGNYYLVALGTGTHNFQVEAFATGNTDQSIFAVSGKSTLQGTYTVTADTIPTSLTLSSISAVINGAAITRFDN